MAEGMATSLQAAGGVELLVANRTWRKARDPGRPGGWHRPRLADLPAALTSVDVLLTSTGSSVPVVEHGTTSPRSWRPGTGGPS
jgi:glutamyl-tRNA reductase